MKIPKNPMIQVQKNIESSKRREQKRQDAKDLRNAGVYDNGRDHYLDKNGDPMDGVDIPVWFKNLSRAWQSNKRLGTQRRKEKLDSIESTISVTDTWNQWCDDRVDLLGEECDPRKPKRKVGRPKLPYHLKKNPTKIKRSDQMKTLLLEHGIHPIEQPSTDGPWEDIFLKEYPDWEFLPNGRLRHGDEPPISVHQFLQNFDTK